jgi:hypothetical protein
MDSLHIRKKVGPESQPPHGQKVYVIEAVDGGSRLRSTQPMRFPPSYAGR